MKAFIAAAALAHLAAAAPAPQQFDFAAIVTAPSPTATGPPISDSTESATSVDSAAIAASISSEVTSAATASATPDSSVAKRGWGWGKKTTTTTSSKATSTSVISTATPLPPQPDADACQKQPAGFGPQVQPDTAEAFLAYQEFHDEAQAAPSEIGEYEIVFRDLNASVSANSYLTYYTLHSYDAATCAAQCDSTDLCVAFNIFAERDPSINPNTNATNSTLDCPNPASITNYKCSLWGATFDESAATNFGQYRDEFQVVIAGSNGYSKPESTPPPEMPGWDHPQYCPGGAINGGGSYWLTSKFFPGPYDPSVCFHFASAQADMNKQTAQKAGKKSYTPVNMFNSYNVNKNGVAQGTYCSLFDTPLKNSKGGFKGGYSGRDYFSVGNSFTYSLSKQDTGRF